MPASRRSRHQPFHCQCHHRHQRRHRRRHLPRRLPRRRHPRCCHGFPGQCRSPPSRLRHPSHSSAAPLVTASVRTTAAAGRHPPTYPDTHPFSHPPLPALCAENGRHRFWVSRLCRRAAGSKIPIGSAPARLVRPWRLRAARRSQEEQSAKKKPPMSSDRLWPCRWSCRGAAARAKLAKRAAHRRPLRRQRPQPYLDATARSARSARRRLCRSRARLCSEPLQPRCSPSCLS